MKQVYKKAMMLWSFALLLGLCGSSLAQEECSSVTVTNEWNEGWNGLLHIPFDHEVDGWEMVMNFGSDIEGFQVRPSIDVQFTSV